MGYINKFSKEDKEIYEYIQQKVFQKLRIQNPNIPAPDKNSTPQSPTNPSSSGGGGNELTHEEAVEIVKNLSLAIGRLIVTRFITLFVDEKMSKLAIDKITQNSKNAKLMSFIKKQTEMIYKKHPNAHSITLKQFMDSGIWEYSIAEFRDKTIKENAKKISIKAIDSLINAICNVESPWPINIVLAIPVKAILVYCGFNIGITGLTNIAVHTNNNTYIMGINYRPCGFTISNIQVFTRNEKETLIAYDLPDPPEELYRITKQDVDDVFEKYSKDDIEKLKGDVERKILC